MINKQKIISSVKYIGIFFIFFILQLKFLNYPWFPSDEQDVMQGGKAIVRGFELYKDFLSQHMPVSYYVSAVFELLGAHSVALQRVYFYAFYAFMWVMIYIRYQKVVRKEVLFLYPIFFIAVIGTYQDGTVVLSEHLAGIGFIILLLEYFWFTKERKLKWSNCIMISISILLTFGTMFVAAFGVFVIAVGVLIQEIIWAREEKQKVSTFWGKLWKRYWKLGVCILVPWIAYMIYLKAKGILYLFFYSAYEINRTIYSKYLEGYGGSIFESLLSMPAQLASAIHGLMFPEQGITGGLLVQILITALAITFIVYIVGRGNRITAIICVAYVVALGTRGYFYYHGTQCVEVLCLLASATVVQIIVKNREYFESKGIIYRVATVFVIMLIVMPYLMDINKLSSLSFGDSQSYYSDMLVKITEKDETVWNCTLSNEIFMQADRVALYNIGGVPWMWEAHGVRVLNDFSDTPPRVVLINRDFSIWGYNLSEYGIDLLNYIDTYYTRYGDSWLYIRNDYFDEAVAKIES